MKPLLLVVRFLLGVVVFVLVLEACARIDDVLSYGAPFWGAYDESVLYVRDRIGQWGKPGARYQKWRLNSLGYRGPELRAGSVRIAVFGASETFGLYEGEGEEYPRQLERNLNSRGGSEVFQVVNVAYPGETAATAVLRAAQIVDQIHPSYAVIYPSAATYVWLPWVHEEPASNGSPAAGAGQTDTPLSINLRISERLRNLLKQAIPAFVQMKLRQREIDREAAKYPVIHRIPEENVLRFQRDLLKLVAALRSRRVEPLLVTHATAFGKRGSESESDRDLLIRWRKFYPMLEEDGFLDMERRMNEAIRQVATQEHLSLVDAANQIPAGNQYFADFSHFTPAGAAVMAAHLADGLQQLIDSQGARGSQRPQERSVLLR